MKKGRHRRFEEARALKRSQDVDLHDLFEEITDSDDGERKPEHDAWADLADEWDSKSGDEDADANESGSSDAADELASSSEEE